MAGMVRGFFKQPQPDPQLSLVLLVVDGKPDPLRTGDVAIPGGFAEPLVVLLEKFNSVQWTSPPAASTGRQRRPRPRSQPPCSSSNLAWKPPLRSRQFRRWSGPAFGSTRYRAASCCAGRTGNPGATRTSRPRASPRG